MSFFPSIEIVTIATIAITRSALPVQPCNAPAMKNGRCRMHGGKSTGAGKGNTNALKHGCRTKKAISEKKKISKLLKECREMLEQIS